MWRTNASATLTSGGHCVDRATCSSSSYLIRKEAGLGSSIFSILGGAKHKKSALKRRASVTDFSVAEGSSAARAALQQFEGNVSRCCCISVCGEVLFPRQN